MAQLLQFPIPTTKLTAILDVLVDMVEPLPSPIQRFPQGKDLENQPLDLQVRVVTPERPQLCIARGIEFWNRCAYLKARVRQWGAVAVDSRRFDWLTVP
ncbi:TPA: hypothetical protein ACU967_007855 [Burkholderia contaminans]|uniref:Uncharacterized protein n=2 Tax=Bacteria TaxID=2 RepID=A0AAP4RB87_9BURK|nr:MULTISPECIES: hypothetical protein [Burkholderia]MDN7570837.1 hypothetical protein [Burkholderia contaminans]